MALVHDYQVLEGPERFGTHRAEYACPTGHVQVHLTTRQAQALARRAA